jgi:hypothetical protein
MAALFLQEVAHKQVINARIVVVADGARLAEIDVGTVGQTHMRLVGKCMFIAAETRTVGVVVEKHVKLGAARRDLRSWPLLSTLASAIIF